MQFEVLFGQADVAASYETGSVLQDRLVEKKKMNKKT